MQGTLNRQVWRDVTPAAYRQYMDVDAPPRPAVVVGTWRRPRPRPQPMEVVKLARAANNTWEVHRTGRQPVTGLTKSKAYAEIAAIVGDCWVYYPPARRHQRTVAR